MKESNENYNKGEITFDTESNIYEEVKIIAEEVEASFPDNSPLINYKTKFKTSLHFYLDLYNKNTGLLGKIQEYNTQLILNAHKINAILNLVNEDKDELAKQKQEFENANGVICALNEAEKKSRKLIATLRHTITTLSTQVEKGEAFNYGEPDSAAAVSQDVRNLKIEYANAAKEIDTMQSQINTLKQESEGFRDSISKLDAQYHEYDTTISNYDKEYNELSTFSENTLKEIEAVRSVVDGQKQKISNISETMQNLSSTLSQQKKSYYELHHLVNDETTKLKTKKFVLQTNQKKLKKITTNNAHLTSQIDTVISDTERKTQEKESETKRLSNLTSEIATSEQTLKAEIQNAGEVDAYKKEMRKKVHNLKEQITNLNYSSVIGQNEVNRTVRQIKASQREGELKREQLNEEKLKTVDAAHGNLDLVQETRIDKRYMQDDKIKIRVLEHEIELQEIEIFKFAGQEQLYVDEKDQNLQKLAKDNKVLDSYTEKIQQQTSLADDLRNQRNSLKKKLLAALKKKDQLTNDIRDKEEECKELEKKLTQIKIDAANDHYKSINTNQVVLLGANQNKELKQLIFDTNHSISALEAEQQILKHLIDEAYNDKLLQQKEFSSATAAKRVVSGFLVERREKIDQLHADMKTAEAHLHKGSLQYREKCLEIETLQNELKRLQNEKVELEKGSDKVHQLEYEHRRLFGMVNQERQKYSALVRETAMPRNVHRWQMLIATDPVYARNIKYCAVIYEKLDVAHRRLIRLNEKKAELEKKIKEAQGKLMPKGEERRKAFQTNIDNYTESIQKKEEQINQLRQMIAENHLKIKQCMEAIDELKSRLNNKRSVYSQLRSRNLASRATVHRNTMFLVDVPESKPMGGGFYIKNPTSQPQVDDDDFWITSGPSKPKSAKKKILRPRTTMATSKRPMTTMGFIRNQYV